MHISALVANALGFVATSFSIVMWVPQARITWRNRNNPIRLAGVSETTQWLSMIGYLLWGVFGILIGSVWVAAPSFVSFPLSIATIVIVRRGRRLVPEADEIVAASHPVQVNDWTGSIPTFLIEEAAIREEAANHTPTTPIAVLA